MRSKKAEITVEWKGGRLGEWKEERKDGRMGERKERLCSQIVVRSFFNRNFGQIPFILPDASHESDKSSV